MAGSGLNTVALTISGQITRADVPGLCERICALLDECGASVVICDVAEADCDAVTVDALARLQLAARRRGCQVRLEGACDNLIDLLAFMGLREVLPC